MDHLTWEWAFYINIPIGIAAFTIAWFTLTLPNKKSTKQIDIAGVLLLSVFTACLIFFTDFGGKKDEGWDSPLTWAFGAGMVLAGAAFVMVEHRAEDPIIPLSLFRNRIFVNSTAIGFTLGLGMFAAIAFVPTFLQMSSGTSAAESGLLMLPMMAGLMGMAIYSGIRISRTGKYRMFPIVGAALTMAAMLWMTTLTAATPIWVICVQLFVFGAGLGSIMQVIVLVVQNSVPADQIGTATSTNNYFREVGASLGVAVFGSIFTARLSESLGNAFTGAGASAEQAAQSTRTLDPQALSQMPAPLREADCQRLRRLAGSGVLVSAAVPGHGPDSRTDAEADTALRHGRHGGPRRGRRRRGSGAPGGRAACRPSHRRRNGHPAEPAGSSAGSNEDVFNRLDR